MVINDTRDNALINALVIQNPENEWTFLQYSFSADSSKQFVSACAINIKKFSQVALL